MDNFKFVITILLLICLFGLMDTHNIKKDILHAKPQKNQKHKATYADFEMMNTRNLLSINKLLRNSQDESEDILSENILMSISKKN